MQDSRSEIVATQATRLLAVVVVLASPWVIYGLTLLLPTFDDWTYLTYPNDDPDFWSYLLPYGNYWRPLDALFGYLLAADLRLFPALNHVVVYAGHLLGTLMVWLVARELRYGAFAALTAALYYLLSPAMLGAVLGIDSINQIWAAAWGLTALWLYLRRPAQGPAVWVGLCLLATLAKENGMMWLLVIPLVGYAFGLADRRRLRGQIAVGAACIAAYWAVRLLLPHSMTPTANEYLQGGLLVRLANMPKFVLLSFTSVDFVSLFHRPSRSVPLIVLTAGLSAPLLCCVLRGLCARRGLREHAWLALAILLLAAPHLATLFSTMHAYAALGMVALLVGRVVPGGRAAAVALTLYVLSALIVDGRHYAKAYASGRVGLDMARQVVAQTPVPPRSAYCICIDRGERRYSSFCVIPYDAFGWGNAVYLYTRHRWPQRLGSGVVSQAVAAQGLQALVQARFSEGYDQVWVVDGTNVRVFRP